jgi:uncharacterized protein YdgA (DUF945 family)
VKRSLKIAVIVAVVVVAYPLAAWLIGFSAEHQWEQREQALVSRFPYFRIVKSEYHRGVYSSTREVAYRLTGPLTNSLRSLPGNLQEADFQVTVRNTIHHGPLPQLRTFAPATIDTEIVLPAQAQAKLAAVLGDKAHLTIHTTQHWLGNATTVVHSTAFTQQMGEAFKAAWRGLDATSDVGRDLNYWKTDLTAPGLEITSAKGNARFEDMRLRTDQQFAFGGLYVGSTSFTLAHLDFAQPDPERKVSLQNLSLTGKSSLQGEYIDLDGKLDADALQVKQYALTRIGYEFRGTHLYGPAVAALNKSLAAVQADAPGAMPDMAKLQETLKTNGVEILLHDPVLELPRIGFAMPEGELLISVKVSAHGLTRSDLDGPPNVLRGAMAKNLQVAADVRIDTELLDKLLDSSGQSERVTAPLQVLQRQGYIKLEGKALTTHLTFEGGQLKVNGLSFPPKPGAMPQPPPGGHP